MFIKKVNINLYQLFSTRSTRSAKFVVRWRCESDVILLHKTNGRDPIR